MTHKISLIALSLALGACAHETGLPDYYPYETEQMFGAAVRQNIAAQTVNPDAPTGTLTASGARTALATKAYEEDDVEKPAASSGLRAGTPDSGDSGGGGGGSD